MGRSAGRSGYKLDRHTDGTDSNLAGASKVDSALLEGDGIN